jgi:hypothetical protein
MSLILSGSDGLSDVDGSAATPAIRGTDANTGIFFPAADTIAFSEGGAEAMRIDSSGNLLVGRTTQLAGVGRSITLGNGTNSSEFNVDRIYFDASNYYVLNTGATGVRLGNGSTSWAAQSDETVKDIIEPITDAVNKVSTLRAVIGKYKKDKKGIRRSFLIAQDVQAVLPEAVDIDSADNTLGLRYTEVIPLLVASIKELKATVDAQAARIAALESVKA